MLKVILLSSLAGAIGTGVGGLVGTFIKESKRSISLMFSFASGTMLGIVFFSLIPEGIEAMTAAGLDNGLWLTILGVALGMLFVFLLNSKVDRKLNPHEDIEQAKTKKSKLFVTGIMILVSVTLHNFPEGLVIGAGEVVDISIITTILITLHNLPEGMAMAVPMSAGGVKRFKVILICMASGLPTVFGAIVGYAVGTASPYLITLCLGLASGSILAIVFSEMIPMAEEYVARSRLSTIAIVVGILAAAIINTYAH